MEENNTSDFTLYILLSVSGLLVVIDGLELFHIIFNWEYGYLIVKPIFESCIKFELISKTVFSIFSFIAAFSAFSLTLFLLVAQNFFLTKFLHAYLYVNYIFFGPMMAALSIMGILYWEDVVYVCDKNNINFKEVSVSNSVTIIGCLLISFLITILVEFLESFNFLLDSILKRESGSDTIGRFFWQIALSRANQARMQAYNGNYNSANNQINSDNIANNQDVVLNVNFNNNHNSVGEFDLGQSHIENQENIGDFNNNNNNNNNNLENETVLTNKDQNTLVDKQSNQNIITRDVDLNINTYGDNRRFDLTNEAEDKNILEKNVNNPVEFLKNT